MTADRPLVLLWIHDAAPYRQGLARAGLDQRVDVVHVPLGETPKPDLLARCEAMLAFRAGAGVLAQMPRLRWLQALTAGVEGWLALPDLPKSLTLTCARGTHRVQMPENILGALFHLTKPYAGIEQDQKARHWRRRVSTTLAGVHARHPGPGRDRPGAGAQGRGPRDARDRHAAPPGADAPRGACVRARRHRYRAGRFRLRAAAAADRPPTPAAS